MDVADAANMPDGGQVRPPGEPARTPRAPTPRARTPRARTPRAEQTRAAIVEAALGLFRERGYEAATMRAIASRAGVSTGNAYYYFSSKEELIQEFYIRNHARHDAACRAVLAAETDLTARLRGTLRALIDVSAPGIVLPEPGYLAAVRELTRRHGCLLINDETHTFSAGPGGCTRSWGLDPDIVTIGKSIAGGIPAGAYGLSEPLAGRILADADADIEDTGGVGGTLAGNALSAAAMRATLEHVLTDAAFEQMIAVASHFTAGVRDVVTSRGLPWTITQLGARAEYRFCPVPPRTGGESAAAADPLLDEYLHLYTVNRGVLMTPFHNMALMSPATTEADADVHTRVFAAAAGELLG